MKIVKHFGFIHLSVGDLLRQEALKKSKYKTIIETAIQDGKIAPVDITLNLIKKSMNQNGKYLIDGFPRNLESYHKWELEMGSEVDFKFLLYFDCPEELMQERVMNRSKTSGRIDDNIHTISKRFATYRQETKPVISLYTSQNKVLAIDVNRSEEMIWKDVEKGFKKCGFTLQN